MNLKPALAILVVVLTAATPRMAIAQAAPGPYEILPFADAYIIEAYYDLLVNPNSNRADWTGWTGTTWESPNAYNNHEGTDFSVGTGTPVYAATTGTVVALETNVPENSHPPAAPSFGNYVTIQATAGLSPKGEQLKVTTMHLLPNVQVTVGQTVSVGQLIGYSDNTGNSTSEHCHVQSETVSPAGSACPLYNGHYKYPIMLNPNARVQIGHVVQVKAATTPLRSDRLDTAGQVATAHQGQYYYASYAQRGYYKVFVPNDAANRALWIKALDVDEVLTGTVIQALPDAGTYVHTAQLAATYPIRSAPNAGAAEIGRIRFGGGRFVADQSAPGGWYRIAVPGASATWGWVQADSKMIVYPELVNPTINLAQRPQKDFPFNHTMTSPVGTMDIGRPKFDRCGISFLDAPGTADDGNAFLLTDYINTGDGRYDTLSFGRPDHRNYFVQADVYFRFQPSFLSGSDFERYGIFARDDGFGGWDMTFEGRGNCYAFTWDSDDGRLRCARIVNATMTDMLPAVTTVNTPAAWHTMRIECQGNTIRFYLDGSLRHTATDTNFPSGLFGLGYSWKPGASNNPSARGAYFRNFQANTLPPAASVNDWAIY